MAKAKVKEEKKGAKIVLILFVVVALINFGLIYMGTVAQKDMYYQFSGGVVDIDRWKKDGDLERFNKGLDQKIRWYEETLKEDDLDSEDRIQYEQELKNLKEYNEITKSEIYFSKKAGVENYRLFAKMETIFSAIMCVLFGVFAYLAMKKD